MRFVLPFHCTGADTDAQAFSFHGYGTLWHHQAPALPKHRDGGQWPLPQGLEHRALSEHMVLIPDSALATLVTILAEQPDSRNNCQPLS